MRTGINHFQRCPGCGNFAIHFAINAAIKELNILSKDILVVSGIGCSGKMAQYIPGYSVEALHGRAIPFAIGAKLANPKLNVLVYAGDGDAYGIGLAHFIHACRRDIDLTYIVADNENYALTTGQTSPTTPLHQKTHSEPEGTHVAPIYPVQLAETVGCGYNISVSSKDLAKMKEVIIEGIHHKGFSHIHIDQLCPSYRDW
ncbi:MAG: hypothetical protein CR971_02630 [candidate division SR1 bacterium]|nr:MAG: hypothetical protein CR971_02630 [candidate division SR1 bacterium]